MHAVAIVAALLACRKDDADPPEPRPSAPTGADLADNFGQIEDQGAEGCDNLIAHCLLPFPSDAFVAPDGGLQIPDRPFTNDEVFEPETIDRNRGFGAARRRSCSSSGTRCRPSPGPSTPPCRCSPMRRSC